MSRWFRFYDEALDDPKVQLLSPELFKAWVNCLCLASKSGGKLPSATDVAFRLRISVQDAEARISELILAGLIDIEAAGERVPHNWLQRQFPSDQSAARMRKLRAKKQPKIARDVTCDGGGDEASDGGCDGRVTPQTPESESEIEIDSELTSPVEQDAAREDGRLQNSDDRNVMGVKREQREVARSLRDRAEGFGLPVADLVAKATAPTVAKPSGYFRKLCLSELQRRAPTVEVAILREAMAGNPAASATAFGALMEGSHA